MDITPDGIWTPSDFNEPDPGLSSVDSYFDPPCLAQMVVTTIMQEGEGEGPTSNTGEDPSTPGPTEDTLYKTFYDMQTDSPHDEDVFHVTSPEARDTDDLYYFDPSDNEHASDFMGRTFHLTLEPHNAINSHDVDIFLFTLDYNKIRGAHEDFDSLAYVSHAATQD